MMREILAMAVLFASSIGAVPLCAQRLPGHATAQSGATRQPNRPVAVSGSGQLLVLKNGQVLQGHIRPDVQSVQVQTDSGSRLVIPLDQVDFLAKTMEQAYWQKSARTRATDVPGQVELFYWCLRNQLLREAQNQIDLLQEMPIKATELEFLDRQLLVALQDKQREMRFRQVQANGWKGANGGRDANRSVTTEPAGEVRQVDYEMDATTAHDFQRLERIKRMERAIDQLPEGAVAMFKRRVEPTLIRACYDCHGSDDPAMPLWRMGRNQVIPRTMSQRNLQSVLQQIRGGDPAGSPLWTAATIPHGENPKPLLQPGTPAYNNLAQWIQWMAAQKPARPHGSPAVASVPSVPAADQHPPNRAAPVSLSKPEVVPPTIPTLQPRRLPKAASPDPFDPAEFNDNYRERPKPAESVSNSTN